MAPVRNACARTTVPLKTRPDGGCQPGAVRICDKRLGRFARFVIEIGSWYEGESCPGSEPSKVYRIVTPGSGEARTRSNGSFENPAGCENRGDRRILVAPSVPLGPPGVGLAMKKNSSPASPERPHARSRGNSGT